jgi:hypothetical protein
MELDNESNINEIQIKRKYKSVELKPNAIIKKPKENTDFLDEDKLKNIQNFQK